VPPLEAKAKGGESCKKKKKKKKKDTPRQRDIFYVDQVEREVLVSGEKGKKTKNKKQLQVDPPSIAGGAVGDWWGGGPEIQNNRYGGVKPCIITVTLEDGAFDSPRKSD